MKCFTEFFKCFSVLNVLVLWKNTGLCKRFSEFSIFYRLSFSRLRIPVLETSISKGVVAIFVLLLMTCYPLFGCERRVDANTAQIKKFVFRKSSLRHSNPFNQNPPNFPQCCLFSSGLSHKFQKKNCDMNDKYFSVNFLSKNFSFHQSTCHASKTYDAMEKVWKCEAMKKDVYKLFNFLKASWVRQMLLNKNENL